MGGRLEGSLMDSGLLSLSSWLKPGTAEGSCNSVRLLITDASKKQQRDARAHVRNIKVQ